MHIAVVGGQERFGRILISKILDRGDDLFDADKSGSSAQPLAFDEADVVLCSTGCDPDPDHPFEPEQVAAVVCAAKRSGVRRFIRVSANGAYAPERAAPEKQSFLQAHQQCEKDVRISDLDWTVVRPATMTDDPGTGCIHLQIYPGSKGDIPRADVADLVIALVDDPRTGAMVMEVCSGTDPIVKAIAGSHNIPPFLG